MRRPEQTLQIQAARFLDLAYPGLLWLHVPNGGARSKVEAGILKAMGVRAGTADLLIILPHGVAAWIELKAGNGKLSAPQQAFRDKAQATGCLFAEARSLAEVAELLERWLVPFGWRPKAEVAA